MTKPTKQRPRCRSAFSLIEVLVALAVLLILSVLTSQLVSMTAKSTQVSSTRMGSEDISRGVMGLMANDIARMVRRPLGDIDALILNLPGNDKLFFLGESPGYMAKAQASDQSSFSLIGYRINRDFKLERLGKALTWDQPGASIGFLDPLNAPAAGQATIAQLWPNTVGQAPDFDGADPDFALTSEDVFRIEFCLVDLDGRIFQVTSNWKAWEDDDGDGIPNLNEIRAVVVAIGVLDRANRAKIPDLAQLEAALRDPVQVDFDPPNPRLMRSVWESAISAPDFAASVGIPVEAAGSIRIYQWILPFYTQ